MAPENPTYQDINQDIKIPEKSSISKLESATSAILITSLSFSLFLGKNLKEAQAGQYPNKKFKIEKLKIADSTGADTTETETIIDSTFMLPPDRFDLNNILEEPTTVYSGFRYPIRGVENLNNHPDLKEKGLEIVGIDSESLRFVFINQLSLDELGIPEDKKSDTDYILQEIHKYYSFDPDGKYYKEKIATTLSPIRNIENGEYMTPTNTALDIFFELSKIEIVEIKNDGTVYIKLSFIPFEISLILQQKSVHGLS